MYFNQFLGPETIEREYKVGVIYWNRELEYEYALMLLRTGKWVFNGCIHNTIKVYFEKYLSKYIAAFTHKLTNTNTGVLYIGVDDHGYVKGLPYRGELSLSSIRPIINNIFNKMLIFSSKEIACRMRNSLKVEIIKIKFDKSQYKDKDWYSDILNYYIDKEITINKKFEYRKRWARILNTQTEKLFRLLNRERFEYIDYIKERELLTKTNYQHNYSSISNIVDVPTYYDMLTDLKLKEFKFISGEELNHYKTVQNYNDIDLFRELKSLSINKELNKERIDELKILLTTNKTGVNIAEFNNIINLYNFGRFKDYCIKTLRKFKPTIPKLNITLDYPRNLLSQIENMIPNWMAHNTSMNLYVIKIIIPSHIIDKNDIVKYYNAKKSKYECCFRKDSKSGPITVLC